MEEIVANALATDSDDSISTEKVLARDSNAVQSTVFPEWKKIGALLSNEGGGPSPGCYALQGLCVALGVVVNVLLHIATADRDDALYDIVGALFVLAITAAIMCVTSARVSLMPGGKLDQLGAGEVMVSEGDATSIARWRKGLLAFSALCSVLFGPLELALALSGLERVPDDEKTIVLVFLVLRFVTFIALPFVLFSGWWASMHTASCLCRDAAVEVVQDVRATDPKDEEQWEAKVRQPALALRGKFELLSDGWSQGLLGVTLSNWLCALAFFTIVLDPLSDENERAKHLAFFALCAVTPFPLAMDIAGTSSWCDTLMAELNEARIKHGEASHLKIRCLETSLKQLNNGQGLGFVLGGNVLDKRSLKAFFIKLVATLSTVIGYLLVLADDVTSDAAVGDVVCDLTTVQKSMVRSVLAERNESCAYNMTVASVLAD